MDALRSVKLTPENLEEYVSNIKCINGQSIFINPDELPKRIVAIGDIHGDLESLFRILLDANVIDISGRWIAVDTFLVQTGDIFDKGRKKRPIVGVGLAQNDPNYNMISPYQIIDKYGIIQNITDKTPDQGDFYVNYEFGEVGDELVIIKFLTDLHIQASEFGNSRVLLCTGNHEVWNTSQYEYFSDTPEQEIQRLLVDGTPDEIQLEINKRRIKDENGLLLQVDLLTPEEARNTLLLFTEIQQIINTEYAHPMDSILFGGPNYPIRREIFKHGRGYLAKKLACILNVVVVVGDLMFCHGGINSINMNSINNIRDLQHINELFRDYLLGNPTNPDEIEKYLTHPQQSLLWNRNIEKDCSNLLELFVNRLKNPNLTIVVGHDASLACIDPIADANRNLPRTRSQYNRTNVDGTVSKCRVLPRKACNGHVYKIDTGISRMNGSPDYREPNIGLLNSLIIHLNPDGSKRSVSAMNSLSGLEPL
jgi:hypothetical protein